MSKSLFGKLSFRATASDAGVEESSNFRNVEDPFRVRLQGEPSTPPRLRRGIGRDDERTFQTGSKKTIIVFFLILLIYFVSFVLIRNHGMMMDENYHYRQIIRFIWGDYTPDPVLPMTPGYHLSMAFLAKLFFSSYPFQLIRSISFVFSMLTVPLFYLLAKKIDKQSALIKTAQYSFFPLVSPFFLIIYTDIFSLLFVLLSLFMIYKKQYTFSALILFISILIRQNNIVWMAFFFVLIYLKESGFVFSLDHIIKHLKKTSAFVLGPVLLAALFIKFGKLSVGTETLAYFTLKNPSNLFIITFLFIFIFLPLAVSSAKETLKLIIKKKIYLLLLFAAFPLFERLFKITHPYNLGTFFLHNALPVFFTFNAKRKLIFFMIMILSSFSLSAVKLFKKEYYLLYPFTVLFLLPQHFIEQRYYIIPYVLFLLFRKPGSKTVEFATAMLFLVYSLFIYQGIFNWKFFI